MSDPLSIATGILTLYQAILELKRLRDALKRTPTIVANIESECHLVLNSLQYAQVRLHFMEEMDLDNPDRPLCLRIQHDIRDAIEELRPDIERLQAELSRLRQLSPRTLLGSWVGALQQYHNMPALVEASEKIAKKRKEFDGLKQELDR